MPGRRRAADLDGAGRRRLGVFDHHDGVGAARHRAAGRDRRGGARQHRPRRRDAAGDHLVVEQQAHRRGLAGRGEIGGTHRKAIDIGAIERRHVDRRHHVLGKRAAERVGERAMLSRYRARKQGGLETRQRVFARQDGQELVLIEAVRVVGQGLVAHVRFLIHATYKHRPARPPQILPSHRAPQARPRRARSHRVTIRPPPA